MKKLWELQPGEQCCVVGTLFKAMPLQPSILREISEEVSPTTPDAPALSQGIEAGPLPRGGKKASPGRLRLWCHFLTWELWRPGL